MRATCKVFATLCLFWTDPPSPLTGVNFLLGSSIFLVSIVPQETMLINNLRAPSPNICLVFSTHLWGGSISGSGYVCHQTAWQSSKQPWMSPWSLIGAFIQTLRTSKRRSSYRSALDVSLLWLKYRQTSKKKTKKNNIALWELTVTEISDIISHPWMHI